MNSDSMLRSHERLSQTGHATARHGGDGGAVDGSA